MKPFPSMTYNRLTLASLLMWATSFISTTAQPLREINYRYLYDAVEPFSFVIRTGVVTGTPTVFYSFEMRDSTLDVSGYEIAWEWRDSFSAKESNRLQEQPEMILKSKSRIIGRLSLSINSPRVLAAMVIQKSTRRAWYFSQLVPTVSPTHTVATVNGRPTLSTYAPRFSSVGISDSVRHIVSYYDDNFPAALPPFSETQGRVSKGMQVDSVFSFENRFTASKTGLYLIQSDTSSRQGIALRIEDDYPKLAKIASLAGPFVYISTKQEHDRMMAAGNQKKEFDKVVLALTGDVERAKKIMRSYFRRVEAANRFFSSYKEGWKTDRGMVYIVFGLPEEVVKLEDREIWNYNNDDVRASFTFLKAATVFDPENYVLMRDRKYQQLWYEVIERWRNARY